MRLGNPRSQIWPISLIEDADAVALAVETVRPNALIPLGSREMPLMRTLDELIAKI